MTPFEASEHPEIERVVPYELAIHKRTNEARNQHGVRTVAYDSQIAYISRRYSEKMANMGSLKHNVGGESISERLSIYGLGCVENAENLSLRGVKQNYISSISPEILADSVVTGWLNSDEGHRENLLDDEWAYEGVGVYVTADAKVYVTQTFTARDCDGPGDPPRYDGEYDG